MSSLSIIMQYFDAAYGAVLISFPAFLKSSISLLNYAFQILYFYYFLSKPAQQSLKT